MPKLHLGSPDYSVELVQEEVENPLHFSKVLKAAFQSRGNDVLKINVSHLYGLNSLLTSLLRLWTIILCCGFSLGLFYIV